MLSFAQVHLGKFAEARQSLKTALSKSPSAQQEASISMSSVQGALVEMETVGAHREHTHDALANIPIYKRRAQLRRDILCVLDDLMTSSYISKETLWHCYALVGVYEFDPDLSCRSLRELQGMGSPLYEQVSLEYIRLYAFSGQPLSFPTIGLYDYKGLCRSPSFKSGLRHVVPFRSA